MKLSNGVYTYRCFSKKIIIKKMMSCFDRKFCLLKKEYIDFLLNNRIKTAKIINIIKINKNIYEIQNFIDGKHTTAFSLEQIKCLANFHNASFLYSKNFNRNFYDTKIIVKDVELDKLLLGFDEKYLIYPLKSLDSLNLNKLLSNKIKSLYLSIYEKFKKNYGIADCIIHNDLTPNNFLQLKNNTYAFIDFDLAILSSVYVDIIDLILTRDYNIEDYKLIFSDKKNEIIKAINCYNEISRFKKIDYKGFILMSALKLLSYYFYLHIKINGIIYDELYEVINFAEQVNYFVENSRP